MKTEILKIKAKSIFTWTKIPGAKWVINQKKEFPKSFEIIKDKAKFDNFIKRIQKNC